MAEQVLTIEDLNPRSQGVKMMEMAVRCSKSLASLCRHALEATSNDPLRARSLPPFAEDYPAKGVGFVFGEPLHAVRRLYTEWWPWFFDQWYSGALDRGEEAAMANMPQSVRVKLLAIKEDE